LEKLGLGYETELHPAMGDAIERNDILQGERLERRERTAEMSLASVTVAAGVLLAALASGGRAFDPWLAAALVVAFALAYRVRFYDGAGYTPPTQIVLVPMLLLLPPGTVPLLVAAAMLLANAERCLRGAIHPARLALGLGDALHAVGPAFVLVLAGSSGPSWGALPIYALALAAQFGADFAGSLFRESFVLGLGRDLEVPLLQWTWLIDALLSIVGLLAALAARDEPFGALLVLPVLALLLIFSRERSARIDQSLELSRAYRGTTLLLSEVLDDNDEYTAFHSRGVVELSLAVAGALGLDERAKRNVEFGALLHDVGKIAIPKEILHKPGDLSPAEWIVMETHTLEGQRLLDRVGGVLGQVGQIVRSSHERWDGEGYPDRLERNDIPVEATIVSVCDAFNAMTTDRPYRRALAVDVAMAELRVHSGSQFSPRVVTTLLALVEADEAMLNGVNNPTAVADT
jgi:hypothetical protein